MDKEKSDKLINKLVDMISTALDSKKFEEADILSRILDRSIA